MTVQAISTKSSAVAVKAESTEGTAIDPTGTGDYIPIQDDFQMESNFDVQDNAERRASIGAAAPIIGLENPTVTGSFYLKGSGTAGTEPAYAPILKAFFGTQVTAGTEYDTVSSSTVSVINVDTGEGANFQRGQGLLIKDATNGYRVRVVESISGDALTLMMALPTGNAPGTGVNLGKAVFFVPANSGHQTLTFTEYKGNGGAKLQVAGARITEFSFGLAAGDLINASFSAAGTSFYMNPIDITSSTKYIDFTNDDSTYAAAVAVKRYKSPHELATAIQDAMNAAGTGETATVTYSDTAGTFTIKSTGTLLTLKWNTGTNTANSIAAKIGFSTAADNSGTGATTGYTGTAQTYTSPYTPALDSTNPTAAKNLEVMIGDATTSACFDSASEVQFKGSNGKVDLKSLCAESGLIGSIISDRKATISVTALLQKYDADKFRRFSTGAATKMQLVWGEKSGGNWVPGKTMYAAFPNCVVSSFSLPDSDGLASMEIEVTPVVDSSGNGEMYVGQL